MPTQASASAMGPRDALSRVEELLSHKHHAVTAGIHCFTTEMIWKLVMAMGLLVQGLER